jgi:hypothetical protein
MHSKGIKTPKCRHRPIRDAQIEGFPRSTTSEQTQTATTMSSTRYRRLDAANARQDRSPSTVFTGRCNSPDLWLSSSTKILMYSCDFQWCTNLLLLVVDPFVFWMWCPADKHLDVFQTTVPHRSKKCKFQASLLRGNFPDSYDNCFFSIMTYDNCWFDYCDFVVFTRENVKTCLENDGKHNDCYHFVCHCLSRPPD